MIGAIGSALQGLFTQRQRVNEAAQSIAEFPVNVQNTQETLDNPDLVNPSSLGEIDLETDLGLDQALVELIDASNLYQANLAVLETAQELDEELLDIFV
jgi:flagellar basal body rod protein FlgC